MVFGFALAVVDQLDEPGAMVELADGRMLHVDSACVPAARSEGDRFLYRDVPHGVCPYTLPTRRRKPAPTQGGQRER